MVSIYGCYCREAPVMDLLWQLFRLEDLKVVPQQRGPEVSRLHEARSVGGESGKLAEDMTVKWMNLVLSNTGIGATVSVFGNEMTVRGGLLGGLLMIVDLSSSVMFDVLSLMR